MAETIAESPSRTYRVACRRLAPGRYELSYGRGSRKLVTTATRPMIMGKLGDWSCVQPAYAAPSLQSLKSLWGVWARRTYAGGTDSRGDDRSTIASADDARSNAETPLPHRGHCTRCATGISAQAWSRGKRLCDACELTCDTMCCEHAGAMKGFGSCDCGCHRGERRKA